MYGNIACDGTSDIISLPNFVTSALTLHELAALCVTSRPCLYADIEIGATWNPSPSSSLEPRLIDNEFAPCSIINRVPPYLMGPRYFVHLRKIALLKFQRSFTRCNAHRDLAQLR